jgi:hypothetical protein
MSITGREKLKSDGSSEVRVNNDINSNAIIVWLCRRERSSGERNHLYRTDIATIVDGNSIERNTPNSA